MSVRKKFDVSGFGSATMDYICIVKDLANYHQIEFIEDTIFSNGGCVPTALVTLQRLGKKTIFSSCFGADNIGEEIMKRLKKEGIDCSNVTIKDDGKTPYSFVQVNKNTGERAIAFFQGSENLTRFNSGTEYSIINSSILLIDGLLPEENLKAARFARENNVKVMIDANILFKNTEEILKYTNYIITSKTFLSEYSGSDDIGYSLKKIQEEIKPEILVTTLGKDGSVSLKDGELIRIPTFKGDEVDTTGAGDVFHGAFIFGILNKWKLEDIMTFSSAVSSIKCRKYGGVDGIPDFKTTLEFLQSRNADITNMI